MFGLIFAFICIVPNVYLFLRIRKLFIEKKYWWYYAATYLCLVLVYPINSFFVETSTELLYNPISLTARYILPFYMYVVLLVLLFDIFLLINRIFKLVAVDYFKSRRFKFAGLGILLLVPIVIVIGGIINLNTIQISSYQIEVPRKNARIDHLKIAFASDFHLKQRTDLHYVERFAGKINLIQPDLLIFGGDLFEGRGDGEKMDRIAKLFSEFHPKYGVFAVLGNHEAFRIQQQKNFFEKAGMQLLRDSVAVIGHAFNLAGRYDQRYWERIATAELLKSANDSLPVILIDHRPTDMEENSKTGADIQFSGHTHNGQLFPFNFITRAIYPLSWGYEKINHTHFFVSSGIMLWGPPVRTTGKSEIVVVEVEFR